MKWALIMAPLLIITALALYDIPKDTATLYLERSIPHIGASMEPDGLDGEGILIAVIDTGIDYSHPDLLGFGSDGKVVGGYNFIDPNQPPIDTNGHGTHVAGIIAASGGITGVAPGAKLLAYKVSQDGEGVSSDLIVRSVEKAVQDGADIINISLGVNKTNNAIDAAVSRATEMGVIVVVAAGNDGPVPETIGSPGRNPLAITVGATYNNLTFSQVATLSVNGNPFVVIPMRDSVVPTEPIVAPIIFGEHSNESDYVGRNVTGAVVLAERGNDTNELLYFSTKEDNAADAGAVALIVFNNEDGMFQGELIHDFIEPGYEPRIPTVSMDREEGLELLQIIQAGDAEATISFVQDPDHPVSFSSRGPTSPFYIKPDVVAPGVYINTTSLEGYILVSGTSYATPHVSGVAALLLQQNPLFTTEDIRSLLATTASEVSLQPGIRASLDEAGSGRINATAALTSNAIVRPPVVVESVTPDRPHVTTSIDIIPRDGNLKDWNIDGVDVQYDIPGADTYHVIDDNTLLLLMSSDHTTEGRLTITHQNSTYIIPILLRYTDGTITTTQDDGRLQFKISHPEGWSFAKITITTRDGEEQHISATPDRTSHIDIYKNGTYYVRADIVSGIIATAAYDTIVVDTLPYTTAPTQFLPDIPWRQAAIIASVAGMVVVVARTMPAVRRI